MATAVPIEVEQGARKDVLLEWTDEDGNPLPGDDSWPDRWEAVAQVRSRAGAVDVLAEMSTANGLIKLSGRNLIDIHIQDEQAANMRRDCEWDLFVRQIDGEWERLAEGPVVVKRAVTLR